MKYYVRFSCGHEDRIDLVGKYADRERKIRWYEESGLCPECYKKKREAEKSARCTEVRMPYWEYKELYPHCATKSESYDKKAKTIIVYIPIR